MNSQVVTMGISSYQKFFREREKREKREAERQRDRERVTERHRETERELEFPHYMFYDKR